MRGYIHYTEDGSYVEAEIASCPKTRREPMSDERFRVVTRLIAGGILAGTTIALAVIAGVPGMFFAGMLDVFVLAITAG